MFTGRVQLSSHFGCAIKMEKLRMYRPVQMYAWKWKRAVHFMSKIVIWIQPQAIQRSYAKVNYYKHFNLKLILKSSLVFYR